MNAIHAAFRFHALATIASRRFTKCAKVAVFHEMSDTDRTRQSDKITVFNDPIHGHISLPEICVRIINTPEFLRLRFIKQLGATYEVFPGAAHNRFEHCIGVAFLAGKFATHLQSQINEGLKLEDNASKFTKEMIISKEDIMCLQVAGLCHDLGHGPMSHVFETRFAKKFDPNWDHADFSRQLFDQLIKNNNIEFSDQDKEFIKTLIHGPTEMYRETGRPAEKNFLYQIVSNEENGIDVDKFDYFARDCYQLGFKNNFDHNRLITFSRVINVNDEWHICYRDKQVEDIYHMFLSRVILHRRACQHKTVQILERMYMEALNKANHDYRLKLRNGKSFKISESLDDLDAYFKLTDYVFTDIRNFPSEELHVELKEAQDILDRIDKRKLYKLVEEAIPSMEKPKNTETDESVELYNRQSKFKLSHNSENDEETIMEGVIKYSKDSLKKTDLLVDISDFHYGKHEQNPVDSVYFYNKAKEGGAYKAFHVNREDVSSLLPSVYSEKHICLYVRDNNKLEEARKCFIQWCKENDMNGKWKYGNEPGSNST